MSDPCTFTTTDAMQKLHEAILVLSGTTLTGVAIVLFKVRLMWGDYKKRHRINGDSGE